MQTSVPMDNEEQHKLSWKKLAKKAGVSASNTQVFL